MFPCSPVVVMMASEMLQLTEILENCWESGTGTAQTCCEYLPAPNLTY